MESDFLDCEHDGYSPETNGSNQYLTKTYSLKLIELHIFNPSSPHDALKHQFTSVKTDLIFL